MEYIIIYLLSGFFGWSVENFYFKKDLLCGDTLNKKLGLCFPILHVWSVGGLILYALAQHTTIDIFILSLIAGVLLTTLECAIGKISKYYNGYRTWNYDDNICPMREGYISLDVTFGWTILSYLALTVMRQIKFPLISLVMNN